MMRLPRPYAAPVVWAAAAAYAALVLLGQLDPGLLGALLGVMGVALAFAVAAVPTTPGGVRVMGGAAVLLALVASTMIVLARDVDAAIWMWALHHFALAGWAVGVAWPRGGWMRGLTVAAAIALVLQGVDVLRLTSGSTRSGMPLLDSAVGPLVGLALAAVVLAWLVAIALHERQAPAAQDEGDGSSGAPAS